MTASTLLVGPSGTLTVPAVTGGSTPGPGVVPTIVGTGPFTGTWAAPANSAWWGTFNATGPFPGSGGSTGTTVFDFTTLSGSPYLPASTYIRLSDLDSTERLALTAFDLAGAPILQQNWLFDLVYLGGSNPSHFVMALMPTWTWDALTGRYTLTGENDTINPNMLYVLQTARNVSPST